jgi:hypothetical protein
MLFYGRLIGTGCACAKHQQPAGFLTTLEAELLAFLGGKTDDQVDSVSEALPFKQPCTILIGSPKGSRLMGSENATPFLGFAFAAHIQSRTHPKSCAGNRSSRLRSRA